FWLRTLLKYKTPPGRVLELGSAHGGFVALLRWAGFDARGLELSPTVAEFARVTFEVPMLVGKIEKQGVEKGSLDVIALMDVLEHLPDPRTTMSHCLKLLKADGLLLIQTPRYPEGLSYKAMLANRDPFFDLLKPDEHLFLFSARSVRQFFLRLNAPYVRFEPAIFSHYDQFLAVSKVDLPRRENPPPLINSPTQRIVQALLDLDSRAKDVERRQAEAEADRAAQLENVHRLEALLAESEADRAARLENVYRLEALLAESEADRAARLATIGGLGQRLEALLAESEADRAAQLENVHRLEALLAESDADRAARLENVYRLEALLAESEADRAARLATIGDLGQRLEALLAEAEADRAAQLENVHRLEAVLAESDADRDARLENVHRLEALLAESEADRAARLATIGDLGQRLADVNQRLDASKAVQAAQSAFIARQEELLNDTVARLQTISASRFFKLLRRFGWRESPKPDENMKGLSDYANSGTHDKQKLKRVVVDLTPVLPGGKNGGAKLVATQLVKNLARLAPEIDF